MSKGNRRAFGSIRRLHSGRYQARYPGPDGTINAPVTFSKKSHAEVWLADRKRDIDTAVWNPAGIKPERVMFSDYAQRWVAERRSTGRPLKALTQEQYQRILNKHLLPAFGNQELSSISPADVRQWHSSLLPDAPAMRAYAYRMLHSVMATAYSDEMIDSNPCRLRGAGQVEKVHETVVASIPELDVATEAMEPRLRCAVTLAAWCALRFGEVSELRRGGGENSLVTQRDEHRYRETRRYAQLFGGRVSVGAAIR